MTIAWCKFAPSWGDLNGDSTLHTEVHQQNRIPASKEKNHWRFQYPTTYWNKE